MTRFAVLALLCLACLVSVSVASAKTGRQAFPAASACLLKTGATEVRENPYGGGSVKFPGAIVNWIYKPYPSRTTPATSARITFSTKGYPTTQVSVCLQQSLRG